MVVFQIKLGQHYSKPFDIGTFVEYVYSATKVSRTSTIFIHNLGSRRYIQKGILETEYCDNLHSQLKINS